MRSWPIYRLVTLAVALHVLAATGCNDESDASAAKKAAEATSEISGDEEELLQRRDALLSSRRQLSEKREELAAERRKVLASGGDTSEVDKKAEELKAAEADLSKKETQLNDDYDKLFEQQRTVLASIVNKGGKTAQMAAREASMAGREKTLSARESRVAEREAAIAERERKLALRERNTCGAAAAPTIISAPPRGTKYRKKDVAPLLTRARRHMSRKGILQGDLPGPVQGLEKKAIKAMSKGDYGEAHFAASQLMATVDTTQINKAFVTAKINRLSARMKGTKLSAGKQKKVDKLFRQATSAYADGKFSRANKRLNEIFSQI